MDNIQAQVSKLIEKYQVLYHHRKEISDAICRIINCYRNGKKVMICGNGGSAADSGHIVGELMKGFLKKRPVEGKLRDALLEKNPHLSDEFLSNLQVGLPAINLCESSALLTAFCNDVNPDYIFAQQVLGLGKKGDVLICISTSGNAANVNNAATIAHALGIQVIGLTGETGGRLAKTANLCIQAPARETYQIQELHLPIYHCICAAVEAEFFER